MTKLLERAVAELAKLPEPDQERIARELHAYVDALRDLRREIEKGLNSLERGGGRELNVEDVIERARTRHAAR